MEPEITLKEEYVKILREIEENPCKTEEDVNKLLQDARIVQYATDHIWEYFFKLEETLKKTYTKKEEYLRIAALMLKECQEKTAPSRKALGLAVSKLLAYQGAEK